MKRRSAGAESVESAYIARLKECLEGAGAEDANDIVQDVREHIESALSEAREKEIPEDRMRQILDRLGPPEKCAGDIVTAGAASSAPSPARAPAAPAPRKKRRVWPYVFLAVNVLGIAAVFGYLAGSKEPVHTLTVLRSFPADKADPASVKEVGIELSAQLDPQTVRDDSIRLVPPMPGTVTYDGDRTLTMTLKKPLARATRYRIMVSPELRGRHRELPPGKTLHFTTVPLRVTDISQARIQRGPSAVIEITFNEKVNPQALAAHLSILGPDDSVLPFETVGTMPDDDLEIKIPGISLDAIRVKIAAGLTGTEGPLPLAQDHVQDVKVRWGLEFVRMTPDFYGERGVIRVRMNSPVDTGAAGPFVEIDPPVTYALGQYYRGMEITGNFVSGRRYRVILKEGLPGGAAGALKRSVTRTVWFSDRPEELRFAFGGGYLSPGGLLKVPVHSVNVAKATLTVQRLYESNIVQYAADWGPYDSIGDLGTHVTTRKIPLEGTRNENTETLLDLRTLAGPDALGVYGLDIRDPDSYWSNDEAIVIVTDLGISARIAERKALVWTTSISTAEPVEGVRVVIYSDRRQELGAAVTDTDGLAEVSLSRTPENEHPEIVIAGKGRQLSFLSLSSNRRSRDWHTTGGRPYVQRGYEVFAFPERGAYRPGDTVKLSAFARGQEWNTPAPMPVDVRVTKPSGKELLKQTVMSDEAGRIVTSVVVPQAAPTGRYRASYHLPGTKESLGAASFLVAEYIPRTLRMKLTAPPEPLRLQDRLEVKAHVEHLFGEPASGLTARCRARYAAAPFAHDEWEGYVFGDSRRSSGSREISLDDSKLDANGNVAFDIDHPDIESPAAVQASVEVEVLEPGGRALVERLSRRLDPRPFYVGLARDDAPPTAGTPIAFALAAVAPDGSLFEEAGRFKVTLLRVTYGSVLRRRSDGRLVYDWMRHETQVTGTEGAFAQGRASFDLRPELPGRYRLVAECDTGCSVTSEFYVQGPGARWEMAEPDQLQLTLDRESYRPGETARVQIRSPFAGTALLCIESDRVVEKRLLRLTDQETTEELTVRGEWRPNVYVTATLIRPVSAEDEWRPHRASGSMRLKVDCGDRKLGLIVHVPGEVRPTDTVDIAVTVASGEDPCPNAAVVIAAVDEGVLALTSYRTPSPWDFFYGIRQLGVQEYDMFSRLAPELAAWKAGTKPEPGGGTELDMDGEMARRLSPVIAKRVKTAVLYAGTLVTDENGAALARFDVPEYLGELRVMAVAAHERGFGSVDRPLPVRSPLMARPSWPRFLAAGDQFEVPVTIFNKTDEGDPIELACVFEGPMETTEPIPSPIEVPAGGEKTVYLRFRALEVGKVNARIAVTRGAEGYGESVELPVRPAVAFARASGSVVIGEGDAQRITIGGDFVPGTERCSLVIASSPLVELAGALEYLLGYPYGCVEQTTSKLVPLVYLKDLVELSTPGALGQGEIDRLMQAGFFRLRMMQTYHGGLAMWPNGSTPYPWGSVYAADMLTEARKAGYDVPEDLFDPLIGYIRDRAGNWANEKDARARPLRFGEAAYGCYVLARAGRAAHGTMARLEEILNDCTAKNIPLPSTTRFHLAAAYTACGESDAARGFIAGAGPTCRGRQTFGYLDSPTRENANTLSILLDIDPEAARIPALAEQLKKNLHLGRWGTTQENAAALMALGKYARRLGEVTASDVTIELPDGSTRTFKAKEGTIVDTLTPGQSVTVRLAGKGRVYAFWHAEGVPREGEAKEKDAGLVVRRAVRTRNGTAPAPLNALVQGELYQVVLSLDADREVGNVVLVDLLPAGLEIENPDLEGTASRVERKAHERWMRTDHVERRDDRLIVFARARQGRSEYRYVVRAVTAGTFVLPAVEASCMYDPGLYSVHGRGTVRITR